MASRSVAAHAVGLDDRDSLHTTVALVSDLLADGTARSYGDAASCGAASPHVRSRGRSGGSGRGYPDTSPGSTMVVPGAFVR
jgi:hypothetical protein